MSLAAPPDAHSAKAAIIRAGRAQIAHALDEAARGPEAASAHELRKRCKEIRGLVQMIRPGLPDHARLNALARDAARELAPARDAEVMLATLDGLIAGLRRPAQFTGLRQRLLDEIARHRAAHQEGVLDDYTAAFMALDAAFAELELSDKAGRVIWAGVARTWARARRGAAHARAALAAGAGGDFDAAAFHDWRKDVKRHWYQARFMAPIRPGRLRRHIAQIDDLGETLGAHNDLDTLMRFLDMQAGLDPVDAQAREILRAHVQHARAALARQALAQADTLLAPPPKSVARRWRRWWRRWRKG